MVTDSNLHQQLLRSQQGELDAVILYQRLARRMKNPSHRDLFLKIAADEGRHASVLRQLTGSDLRPKPHKARMISLLLTLLGLKRLLKMISAGEASASGAYAPLAARFPEIRRIMEDEERHAGLLADLIKTL